MIEYEYDFNNYNYKFTLFRVIRTQDIYSLWLLLLVLIILFLFINLAKLI